jgi:hypothetical protein
MGEENCGCHSHEINTRIIKSPEQTLPNGVVTHTISREVPQIRAKFLDLLSENPNYFGTVPGSTLKAVEQIKYNTTFEEIKCIGLYPEKNQLKAVIVVKLPYGFNGDLCTKGSYEHVRFFIDWNNDGDYNDFNEDVGVASVNVHDIPQAKEKEICYTVVKEFKPLHANCEKPFIVNVRAILSWQVVPTGPNFIPVWGNVVECKVQVAPTAGAEKAVEKVEKKAVQEVEKERQHFTELLLENPNYFGTLPGSKLTVVQQIQYDTRYEQLECVGALPEENIISATFKVKLPYGFNGGLCTPGSHEYIRFFIDWDNDGDYTDFDEDLGLVSVNVHDIQEAKKSPLCYAACKSFKSPRSNCQDPLVVKARAILSWQVPPTGPSFIPPWGNVMECWIQIAPTERPPGGLIAQITDPIPNAEPAPCVTVEPLIGCVVPPQKYGIKITGTAAGGSFAYYDLKYRKGAGPWLTAAVVYPEPAPCGTSASISPTHSVPKFNSILGYLDPAFLTPGIYDVLLTVHDSAAGTATAMTTFDFPNIAVNLTGAGYALITSDFDGIIARKILKLAGSEVSVGGSISIRGSANVDGCQRIIKQYQLYRSTSSYSPSPPPVLPPPPTPPDPTWTNILPSPIDYAPPAHPYWSFCFWFGGLFSNIVTNGILTRVWSTLGGLCAGVPYLENTLWDTTTLNGRYVVLLEVQDEPTTMVGPINTRYDNMVVWVDNKNMTIQITGIEGVAPCADLHLKDFIGKKAKIWGFAWDPLIIDTAPATSPNDNFGDYSLSFVKQGDGGAAIPALTPGIRVPNILPALPPSPPPPALPGGVLAEWDIISAIDAGPMPSPYTPPPSGKLYRGESCTYDLYLSANDRTLVGDGANNHGYTVSFPVKIVNDL